MEDEEKQKLILPKTKNDKKNKDPANNDGNISDQDKDSISSENNHAYSVRNENGFMSGLNIDNCNQLPRTKSTVMSLGDGKCYEDNKNVVERQSVTKSRSSIKYVHKDNNPKDTLNTNERTTSVIFSGESTVLIQIAPKNEAKVIYIYLKIIYVVIKHFLVHIIY